MIKIEGFVTGQPFSGHDNFLDRFLRFVEMSGWYFGGGTEDVMDKEAQNRWSSFEGQVFLLL
jgi:hypothetical protein